MKKRRATRDCFVGRTDPALAKYCAGPRRRVKCFSCNERACRNCMILMTRWFGHNNVRVCFVCAVDMGAEWAVIWKRVRLAAVARAARRIVVTESRDLPEVNDGDAR